MPATTFLLLIATVLSVDGDVARIDRGRAAGLRPGDAGAFYYLLTVGTESRRVDAGTGTVIEVGERHALVEITGEATVSPGHLIELRIPVAAEAAEELLRRARTRDAPNAAPIRRAASEPEAAEASVRDFVLAWAAAWSEQRVGDYFACYARNYRPPGGISRDRWQAQRRRRIERPASIAVDVEGLEIVTVASRAAVATFVQSYRSDTFSDRVSKLLDLVRENGEWRILEERLVDSGP